MKGAEMLTKFLTETAWPMEKPVAYGTFHLTFFLVEMAVVVLLAWLLRNTDEKQNRTVLLCSGAFLFLCELYKQLFYTFVIGGGQYQWWIFPFQLCSIPMYLCFAAPFIKNEKYRGCIYDFMLAFNSMGGFVSFFEPSGLMHEYWTLTVHAFVWHLSIIFIGLYLFFSKRAGRRLIDYRRAVVGFIVLCCMAFAVNLIFWKASGGTINMFFIGPANSSIIVFKDIAAKYGWYVNAPIYIFAMCLGAFLFYAPFALINRKRLRVPVGER